MRASRSRVGSKPSRGSKRSSVSVALRIRSSRNERSAPLVRSHVWTYQCGSARVLYGREIARWAIERGARKLADGTALRELPVGSDEWLESEILALRGDAVVLEPAELRTRIAERARALAKELGVERLRVRA